VDFEVEEEWMEDEGQNGGCKPGFVEEARGEAQDDGGTGDVGAILVDPTRME